jgi:hypothetical protein
VHLQLDEAKLSITATVEIKEVRQLQATIQGSDYLQSGYWINSSITTTVTRKIHHHSMNYEEHSKDLLNFAHLRSRLLVLSSSDVNWQNSREGNYVTQAKPIKHSTSADWFESLHSGYFKFATVATETNWVTIGQRVH